jgi:hypothetical protein
LRKGFHPLALYQFFGRNLNRAGVFHVSLLWLGRPSACVTMVTHPPAGSSIFLDISAKTFSVKLFRIFLTAGSRWIYYALC